MKKQFVNFVCGGTIVAGIVLSLANAADDYGLHSGNVHPLIMSQADDTNGETNGSPLDCSHPDILCGFKLHSKQPDYLTILTDSNGDCEFFECSVRRLDPNSYYKVKIVERNCTITYNKSDYCNVKKTGHFILSVELYPGTTNDETF